MEDVKSNSADKDLTEIRRKIVRDLIANDKTILSIADLISKVEAIIKKRHPDKYPAVKIKQSTISKDFGGLGIKARGRSNGFYFTDEELEKQAAKDIEKIFELAEVNHADIIQTMHPLIIKIEGYSHAISKILKEMYPSGIIETICLESSLVIFCRTKNDREEIHTNLLSLISNVFGRPSY